MKKQKKYEPEDLESLLKGKSFSELYPEEKEFVLQHIEDEEEYASLRSTMFVLEETLRDDQPIIPSDRTRASLLEMFDKKEKKGFVIWLNGWVQLLFPANTSIFSKPGVQWSFGIGILLISAISLWPSEKPILAEVHTSEVEQSPKLKSVPSDSIANETFDISNQPLQENAPLEVEEIEDIPQNTKIIQPTPGEAIVEKDALLAEETLNIESMESDEEVFTAEDLNYKSLETTSDELGDASIIPQETKKEEADKSKETKLVDQKNEKDFDTLTFGADATEDSAPMNDVVIISEKRDRSAKVSTEVSADTFTETLTFNAPQSLSPSVTSNTTNSYFWTFNIASPFDDIVDDLYTSW